MRIAIGCDDDGFPMKAPLISALESEGHVVLDLGCFSADPVDYPDYARAVGQAVLRGFADRGVLICSSATGASIAANKVRSIRAVFCPDVATARQSREEDDANVLCVGRGVSAPAAVEVARTWLGTEFSGAEAHARRLAKIAQLEDGVAQTESARATPHQPDARTPSVDRPARIATPALATPAAESVAPSMTAAAGLNPNREQAAPGVVPPSTRRRPHGPDPLDAPLVRETLAFLESQSFLDRLWTKDATLWRGDPTEVSARLGWLTAPAVMRTHIEGLRAFADEIRRLQFSQVIVLGMGASAACADVFGRTFKSRIGFPDLMTLDTTEPAAVMQVIEHVNVPRTLFVVSSTSGTTAETLALYRFCRARVEAAAVTKPGTQFVAITDPGTPLGDLARDGGFRHTFLNPASIGDRYAALSYVGVVPAALLGVDLKTLLDRARVMVEQSGNSVSAHESAPVRLGAALAAFAKAGRDKVTLVVSDGIRALGAWVELLLAESLGKEGKGLVPVADEPLGGPAAYGADRVFVALLLDEDSTHDAALDALADAGHPVIRIPVKDPFDIGAEFFRWQLATATAGAVLGVNPFDEPDGSLTAKHASRLLAQWKKTRRLPEWQADVEEAGIVLMTNTRPRPASVAQGIANHLGQARPGDYLAIQAYLEPSAEVERCSSNPAQLAA